MTTGLGKPTQLNGGGARIVCIKELGVSDACYNLNETRHLASMWHRAMKGAAACPYNAIPVV